MWDSLQNPCDCSGDTVSTPTYTLLWEDCPFCTTQPWLAEFTCTHARTHAHARTHTHTHTHTRTHTHTHTHLSVPFELNQEHLWFSLGRAGTFSSSYHFLIAVSQTRTAPPSSNLTQTAAALQTTLFTAEGSLLHWKQLSWAASCKKFILKCYPSVSIGNKNISPLIRMLMKKENKSIKYFTRRSNFIFSTWRCPIWEQVKNQSNISATFSHFYLL